MKTTTAALALLVALSAAPAAAQPAAITAATLLDRIQIEDMITRYYYNLGGGAADSFSAFYTDDAVLDINGLVYHGRTGIDEAYRVAGRSSPARHGTFRMLLNNPLIEVTGDRATARFLWTGILNDTATAPPRFVEQGREYDLLVKRGGEWRIQKRTIIADSGLPEVYERTYTPRKDYDVTAGEVGNLR